MSIITRFTGKALLAVALMFGSNSAQGFINFGDASSLTQSNIDAFLQTGVIATLHRPHRAATSMGLAGFDIGAQLMVIDLPDSVSSVISTVSQGNSAPDPLIFPKVVLGKGLPFGIDLGFSMIFYPVTGGNLLLIGGDVQWQLPLWKSIPFMPSFAVRGSYSYMELGFVTGSAQAVDFIISENLKIIEPYVGIGYQFGQGEVSLPGATALPVGVDFNSTFAEPHVFFGLPFNFAFFHVVGLYDYSFTGQHNISVKLSFGI